MQIVKGIVSILVVRLTHSSVIDTLTFVADMSTVIGNLLATLWLAIQNRTVCVHIVRIQGLSVTHIPVGASV